VFGFADVSGIITNASQARDLLGAPGVRVDVVDER
jgi:hypothetical protein